MLSMSTVCKLVLLLSTVSSVKAASKKVVRKQMTTLLSEYGELKENGADGTVEDHIQLPAIAMMQTCHLCMHALRVVHTAKDNKALHLPVQDFLEANIALCKKESGKTKYEYFKEEQHHYLCEKVYNIVIPVIIADVKASKDMDRFCSKVNACTRVAEREAERDSKGFAAKKEPESLEDITEEVLEDKLEKLEEWADTTMEKMVNHFFTKDVNPKLGPEHKKFGKSQMKPITKDAILALKKTTMYADMLKLTKDNKVWEKELDREDIEETVQAILRKLLKKEMESGRMVKEVKKDAKDEDGFKLLSVSSEL